VRPDADHARPFQLALERCDARLQAAAGDGQAQVAEPGRQQLAFEFGAQG
jgi:hypothetical protein